MARIMIVGVSSGVGKSTFARALSKRLQVPVYHLDAMFWKSGWVESSPEEFAAAQRNIVLNADWIIEGNYSSTFDIRAERADTIIYLERPLVVCLIRVFKRWRTHFGTTRPDLAEGCVEKVDWDFLKFILRTYRRRKRNMQGHLERFQTIGCPKTIVKLRTNREIRGYLDTLDMDGFGVDSPVPGLK